MVWNIILPDSSLRFLYRLFWNWCWLFNTFINWIHSPYFDTAEMKILVRSCLNLQEFALDSILYFGPFSFLWVNDGSKLLITNKDFSSCETLFMIIISVKYSNFHNKDFLILEVDLPPSSFFVHHGMDTSEFIFLSPDFFVAKVGIPDLRFEDIFWAGDNSAIFPD